MILLELVMLAQITKFFTKQSSVENTEDEKDISDTRSLPSEGDREMIEELAREQFLQLKNRGLSIPVFTV